MSHPYADQSRMSLEAQGAGLRVLGSKIKVKDIGSSIRGPSQEVLSIDMPSAAQP